ncbi:uncharacterized protein LOC114247592 [Bombyx mandarina]|uniref:Uncharacterized protein LOC114247592 n=1 Tax=Bombyx mandarina TaxID=7092 RepID=A0A6J2K3A0_BOMMA|nr:uncharacterized protein LOC114247592 [Bombyx mandarina]
MLSVAGAVLACLCLARTSPAEPYNLRVYSPNTHSSTDTNSILASIEERLRVLETVSAVQAKQTRRLDAIQDKLDRVETTLSLKLERVQLAAERLEHRLHMFQVNIQTTVKENTQKLERSQTNLVAQLAQNLTSHIDTHKHLLEKANGAYAETWHRGLVLESLMRDGLSLVNVTRRELADGLRTLARRQRDARLTSADIEANFARRINENTYKIDLKMKEVLEIQKRFMNSCERIQLDGPTQVADVLDKLIDSLINKTAATFHELQNIQVTLRNHDNRVMKLLGTMRVPQNDPACRRLETAFRNTSHTVLRENELKQLTEKFVALTDRADAALQRLEAQLSDSLDEPVPSSEVTAEADRLLLKLKGLRDGDSSEFDWEDDAGYFDDGGGGDIMEEDKLVLSKASNTKKRATESASVRHLHRRHLHKHPFDRGPNSKDPSLT